MKNIQENKEKIISYLENHPNKQFNYKQLSKRTGLQSKKHKIYLIKILDELAKKELINKHQKGKYSYKAIIKEVEAVVDAVKTGGAYLMSADLKEDYYIKPTELNYAMHLDKVKLELKLTQANKVISAKIIDIIERRNKKITGIIEKKEDFAFLLPDNQKITQDIFIPLDKFAGAKNKQKVVAEIYEYPSETNKNPVGKVVRVLGNAGEITVELNSVMEEFSLSAEFSKEIIKEANLLEDKISKAEIKKRRDFRAITTFTIDPEDAKDFDDAISVEKIDDQQYEIAVHIADVSHYIKEKSLLDEEAYKRATSVYLVDQVVPMLPEKISNNLCSLRPNEDKLSFAVILRMTENAKIISVDYKKTIINSNRRFNYDEVQKIIENKKGEFSNEILLLDKIAKKLRKQRFDNGSINFERQEVKFSLDKNKKPVGVFLKESKDANKLVEEFMLIANCKVAEFVNRKKTSSMIYRIHDKPDKEKLKALYELIKTFGYKLSLNVEDKNLSKNINKLLKQSKAKLEARLIDTLTIRTMSKAVYDTENIGHYGLHFDYYTHFTSPIRRYPDLIVHRILEHFISSNNLLRIKNLKDKCKYLSEKERIAVKAERVSTKQMQVEFMKDRVGEEFDAIIVGVVHFGLFVETIDSGSEGLISFKSFKDDFYSFDEKKHAIIGRKSNNKYQLGEIIRVKLIDVDVIKRTIDFEVC